MDLRLEPLSSANNGTQNRRRPEMFQAAQTECKSCPAIDDALVGLFLAHGMDDCVQYELPALVCDLAGDGRAIFLRLGCIW